MTNPRYLDHRAPNPPLVDNRNRVVTKELIALDGSRAEIMQEVRDALYEYGDLEGLAERVGRSARCLYAIRGGYTRWPRWETLFSLMEPLGLKLVVMRVGGRMH